MLRYEAGGKPCANSEKGGNEIMLRMIDRVFEQNSLTVNMITSDLAQQL